LKSIVCITTDVKNNSVFTNVNFEEELKSGMLLTHQISAINFRFRESKIGYETNWHLAGDPTLIIILKGILRITLHNEIYKDFIAGTSFIAADNLLSFMHFDPKLHGHKASVLEDLQAIHIKLNNWIGIPIV
jgi:hypothetical protein